MSCTKSESGFRIKGVNCLKDSSGASSSAGKTASKRACKTISEGN